MDVQEGMTVTTWQYMRKNQKLVKFLAFGKNNMVYTHVDSNTAIFLRFRNLSPSTNITKGLLLHFIIKIHNIDN